MQALEICHFRRVTGLDQCFKARLNQSGESAAQDDLFAEQVGLGFFAKVGFYHASTRASVGCCIRERELARLARFILMHGNE